MADQATRPTTETCYLCPSPAYRHCEHCHRPICLAHTRAVPRMSWQIFRDPANQGSQSWGGFLLDPDAAPWQMCPECAEEIQRHNTHEHARDLRNTWIRRGVYLLVIAAIIVVTLLLHR